MRLPSDGLAMLMICGSVLTSFQRVSLLWIRYSSSVCVVGSSCSTFSRMTMGWPVPWYSVVALRKATSMSMPRV